jgi:hypothetical protein
MRRLQVITTGFGVSALVAACAASPGQAPRRDLASGPPRQHAVAQGAVTGKHRLGGGVPSSGGQQPGMASPGRALCARPPSAEAGNGPLPCTPLLLVPVIAAHPRLGIGGLSISAGSAGARPVAEALADGKGPSQLGF